jgi:hypothetical protein
MLEVPHADVRLVTRSTVTICCLSAQFAADLCIQSRSAWLLKEADLVSGRPAPVGSHCRHRKNASYNPDLNVAAVACSISGVTSLLVLRTPSDQREEQPPCRSIAPPLGLDLPGGAQNIRSWHQRHCW